jgi:hypothetical protein
MHPPLVGQGLLIFKASRSHSDTLNRYDTSGRVISPTETSTRKRTTLTRDRHPCARRDSIPQSQQPSGRRPKPWAARPLGLASERITRRNYSGLMNRQISFIVYGYSNVQLVLVISVSCLPVSRIP